MTLETYAAIEEAAPSIDEGDEKNKALEIPTAAPPWIELAKRLVAINDDAKLIAAIKSELTPSADRVAHLDEMVTHLAPLFERGKEVASALADAIEALSTARDEAAEIEAMQVAQKKMRVKSEYAPKDWSIIEYKELDVDDDQGVDGKRDRDREPIYVAVPVAGEIRFPARTKKLGEVAFGLVVSVKGLDGVWRDAVLSRADLVGDGEKWLKPLYSMGFFINVPAQAFRQLVQTIEPAREILTVEQGGWFKTEEGKNAFVLPSARAFTPDGTQREYLYGGDREIGAKYQTAGTLEDWKREVAALAVGNTRLTFAISASFASMLLKPLGLENGGFHFVGSSSMGKTKALTVAASVFGGQHYVTSWKTTANALENRFYAQNDTCVCLDEAGEMERGFGSTVYMLGNGVNKGRMKASGESRAEKHWRLIALSTGEKTVEDHMREHDEEPKAGHTVRLINIKADAGKGHGLFENLHGMANGKALADKIDEVCCKCYGTPSIAFARYLVDNHAYIETLRDVVKSGTVRLLERHGLKGEIDGQVYRVAGKFVLVALAGELAVQARVVDWSKGNASDAASSLFGEWLEARGTAGDLEVKLGIDAVLANLEQYARTRFDEFGAAAKAVEYGLGPLLDRDGADVSGRDPNPFAPEKHDARVERWGFREATDDGTIFYVFRHAFPKICDKRDPKKVVRELADRGWLERGGKDRWTKPKTIGGQNYECYWVKVFTKANGDDQEVNMTCLPVGDAMLIDLTAVDVTATVELVA